MKNRLIKLTDWYQFMRKHRIGRRLAIYILAFSSVVTLILTVLQLSIEYNKDIDEIDSRLAQIRESYSKSLANSLWVMSQVDIKLQLDGIKKLPDIDYIEVVTDQDEVLAFSGSKTSTNVIEQIYPLNHIYKEKNLLLGEVHIVATLDGIYERLVDKIYVILLTQSIKTFVVSLFIIYLFQLLVGRHLVTIAQFISTNKHKNIDKSLKLNRTISKYTQDDELEQTVDAINRMRKNLHLTYSELIKSEKKLNKAQEISHVGGWQLNIATGEIDWSSEVYHIYELEPFSQVIDFDWINAHLYKKDIDMLHNALEKALSEQKDYDLKHRILTVNGNEKFVHQKAEVYWEGNVQKMSGTIQDITKSQYAMEQISRLSQVVDQNPFSTIITDKDGVIQFLNMQAVAMSGYTEQELIGNKMNIFSSNIHPKEFFADLWNTIMVKQEMWRGTIINKMKNGETIDCSSAIFPLFNENHEVTNFVTIQEDVTQQNIKEKLFMLQTRQAQMGEMISVIAHQWRQPLGAIASTTIDLLMQLQFENFDLNTKEGQQAQSAYFSKRLTRIEEFVKNLSTIIDDFRNFYQPNKKSVTTRLDEVISKSLRIIQSSLDNDNIKITKEYSSNQKIELYDNEIVQVLLNLFKNAQDNFIEKKIKNPEITIKTTDNTISISDNGGGIEDSVIERIFEPYFSTKDEKNGTGLGLYMSKTIVEKHHNGRLSVNNLNNGVCFSIELGDIMPIENKTT